MVQKAAVSANAKKRTRQAAPKKVSARSRKRSVTIEEKHQLISQAAYYRAEQRGFIPGLELEDWLAAEDEINRLLQPKPRAKARA